MTPLAVETDNLAKSYGDVTALAGLDLAVPSGKQILLEDPSGNPIELFQPA